MEYAKSKGIEVDATPKAPYSIDENMFHTSYESVFELQSGKMNLIVLRECSKIQMLHPWRVCSR